MYLRKLLYDGDKQKKLTKIFFMTPFQVDHS